MKEGEGMVGGKKRRRKWAHRLGRQGERVIGVVVVVVAAAA